MHLIAILLPRREGEASDVEIPWFFFFSSSTLTLSPFLPCSTPFQTFRKQTKIPFFNYLRGEKIRKPLNPIPLSHLSMEVLRRFFFPQPGQESEMRLTICGSVSLWPNYILRTFFFLCSFSLSKLGFAGNCRAINIFSPLPPWLKLLITTLQFDVFHHMAANRSSIKTGRGTQSLNKRIWARIWIDHT